MQDILWKQIIEVLFPDFVAFFLPNLAKQVDFSRGYDFLDKEFETLFPKSKQKKGRHHVDKLVKVFLKEGQEQWILIHAEVQGYHDKAFAQRMFTYFYRVFDHYKQKVATIAIFSDARKDWKPNHFKYQFDQTNLLYSYPVYKILEQNPESLKSNDNPFAQVVLAVQYALKSKGKDENFTYHFKIELTQLLFQKGFPNAKIEAVFHFLDCLLHLKNPLLQEQFFEEAKEMATTQEQVEVIGDFQRVAMHRGRQEGRQEEKESMALKMLAEGLADALIIKISGLTKKELNTLKKKR